MTISELEVTIRQERERLLLKLGEHAFNDEDAMCEKVKSRIDGIDFCLVLTIEYISGLGPDHG